MCGGDFAAVLGVVSGRCFGFLMGVRFFEVLAAHWPVFGLLAGLVGVMGVIAFWRGRGGVADGKVTRAEVVGWACVLILPPVIYVLGLASGLGVEAALFVAMLGAAVLLWVFGLVEEFVPALVTVGDAALVATAEDWRAFVSRVADADVLLVLGTHDLPGEGGVTVTAAEINGWTQAQARPLPIGTQVNFVEDGGGLSFSPPPEESGAKAIELALDWLDDRNTPGAPPPVVSDHFEVAVRPAVLAARGLVLPPIYLEAARENGALFR